MSVTVTSFGFAPTQISGCQLWLDGADPAGTGVVPSAGTLSSWADKSGLGNNTTAPTGRHPTLTLNSLNSLSVMTFSGGQNLTGNISLGGTTFTQFALYSNSAVTVGQAYMDSSDGPVGKLCAQNGGGNQFQPGFAYGSTFQTGGGYRLVSTNCTNPGSSSTVSIWFNGTNQNISGWNFYGAATTAITSVTIGARKDLVYFSGRIAEIIVYNVALTSTQQQQIEGYLAQKWGILSSLPNGVLGKSNTYFTSMSLLSKAGSATVAPIRITPYTSVSYTFAPSQISNCQLWLDSFDPLGTGTPPSYGATFTTLADKSGNARNFSVHSGTTYYCNYESRPSIFISNSIMYASNAVNLTSYTVFIVCQSSNYADNQTAFVAMTGVAGCNDYNSFDSFGFYVDATANRNRFYGSINQNVVYNSFTAVGANYYPLSQTCYSSTSAGSLLSYANGNVGGSQNSSITRTGTATGFAIGCDYVNDATKFYSTSPKVFINEIIVYNFVLSDVQRRQVEAYLSQKWALTISLPGGHTGLTVPYYVNQSFLSRAARTIPIKIILQPQVAPPPT